MVLPKWGVAGWIPIICHDTMSCWIAPPIIVDQQKLSQLQGVKPTLWLRMRSQMSNVWLHPESVAICWLFWSMLLFMHMYFCLPIAVSAFAPAGSISGLELAPCKTYANLRMKSDAHPIQWEDVRGRGGRPTSRLRKIVMTLFTKHPQYLHFTDPFQFWLGGFDQIWGYSTSNFPLSAYHGLFFGIGPYSRFQGTLFFVFLSQGGTPSHNPSHGWSCLVQLNQSC